MIKSKAITKFGWTLDSKMRQHLKIEAKKKVHASKNKNRRPSNSDWTLEIMKKHVKIMRKHYEIRVGACYPIVGP